MHRRHFWLSCAQILVVVACLGPGGPAAAQGAPDWTLRWEDDFNFFDGSKWTRIHSTNPTNNSLHAYLSEQVTIEDGRLVITSEDEPYQNLPYRSGQVISKSEQRRGRWEVRAKLPTSAGMWPAIWLLPDVSEVNWPSGGEIDIMENRGNQPHLTSSAFHYGTNPPYRHDFVYHEQQTRAGGQLVNYHDSFHTYAVDWTDDYLRFYVDDVHFYTVHDEDVGDFLSTSTQPMQLVINTAVGGHFLPNPDGSTEWPQRLEVDWVRVYDPGDEPAARRLANGGFEHGGGTLAGWSVFGDTVNDNPNVLAADEATLEGGAALKLFGTFGGQNFSGVAQGITVSPGQQVSASLSALVRSADSIAGTDNRATMKIEFYSAFGAKYGGDGMLGEEEIVIADGATPADQWGEHTLTALAPEGAAEARLAIVFHQPGADAGAVHVDGVSFAAIDPAAAAGDFNGDGLIDARDFLVWRDSLGAEAPGHPADGDGDGRVGAEDYAIWQSNFGGPAPGADAIATPEPSTSCLSVSLIVLLLQRAGPLAALTQAPATRFFTSASLDAPASP